MDHDGPLYKLEYSLERQNYARCYIWDQNDRHLRQSLQLKSRSELFCQIHGSLFISFLLRVITPCDLPFRRPDWQRRHSIRATASCVRRRSQRTIRRPELRFPSLWSADYPCQWVEWLDRVNLLDWWLLIGGLHRWRVSSRWIQSWLRLLNDWLPNCHCAITSWSAHLLNSGAELWAWPNNVWHQYRSVYSYGFTALHRAIRRAYHAILLSFKWGWKQCAFMGFGWVINF
jgi:hypothetical protein